MTGMRHFSFASVAFSKKESGGSRDRNYSQSSARASFFSSFTINMLNRVGNRSDNGRIASVEMGADNDNKKIDNVHREIDDAFD